MRVDAGMYVDEAMRRWPWTIRTFIHWRMKCVGCPFGTFHSIDHACEEHGTDRDAFVAALEEAIEAELASRSLPRPAA